MENLHVTKASVAYGAKTGGGTVASIDEINLLAEGAIAVFTNEGALIPLLGPVPATADSVIFALGRPTGVTVKRAPYINRTDVAYETKSYVAPQAKIVAIGCDTNTSAVYGSLNLPSTLTAGQSASIWLYDLTKPYWDERRKKHYEAVAGVGSTFLTVITELVAKINADANAVADATLHTNGGLATGILLTGHTAGNDFGFEVGGIIYNADIQEAGINVSGNLGVVFNGAYMDAATFLSDASHTAVARMNIKTEGSSKQIAELETNCSVDIGNTNWYRKGPEWTVPTMVVTGQTYDVITIKYINEKVEDVSLGGNLKQTLYIAIPSADSATLTAPLVANIIANL